MTVTKILGWFGRRRELRKQAEIEASATGLHWTYQQLTPEQHSKGWGSYDGGTGKLEWYYQYYCELCGEAVTPGPSGGGTNQVCHHCKVNYGCLPGALER